MFVSTSRPATVLGFLIALIFIQACTPGDAKDVVVAWRLFDGRSCMDTTVEKVRLTLDGGAMAGTMASDICHAQAADNHILLRGVRAGAQLHGQALSADQAVLYRAELPITDPVPSQISLSLYYTGGDSQNKGLP